MPKCSSCQAEIFWRRHLVTSKSMPINMGPDPNGTLRLIREESFAVVKATEREAFLAAGGVLYTSHYATCPAGSVYRNRRRTAATNAKS